MLRHYGSANSEVDKGRQPAIDKQDKQEHCGRFYNTYKLRLVLETVEFPPCKCPQQPPLNNFLKYRASNS